MPHTWGSTGEDTKGKGISECADGGAGGWLVSLGLSRWREKRKEDPILVRRSLHNKGTGQVSTTREEWVGEYP